MEKFRGVDYFGFEEHLARQAPNRRGARADDHPP